MKKKIQKNVEVNTADINFGPVRHEELPMELVQRIHAFKEMLIEVEQIPLEETIDNFKRDMHPDREVAIWEHIASAYQIYVTFNPGLDLFQKKDLLSVLLNLSMNREDFSAIQYLNKEQIGEIVLVYNN